MELSQAGIARLYLAAWVLGAALGLFFDLLRLPGTVLFRYRDRKELYPAGTLRKRRAVAVAVFWEDFLFCLTAAVAMILLFYEGNNGKIRPFAFAVTAAGYLLYRATLGRLTERVTRSFAVVLRRTVQKVLRALAAPIRAAGKRLRKAIGKTVATLRDQRERRARKTYTKRLFRTVGINAAGLLPNGERLAVKKEEAKNTARAGKGKRRSHGGKTHKQDHRAEQESLA